MINSNEKRGAAKAVPLPPPATSAMENRLETVFIKDIHVGMKNLTITCIVLEVGQPVILKENREVRTMKVADQTACINLAVWDDTGHFINASDILRLTKAYATTWRNTLTLYTSKMGSVEKIGEFCMVFNDQLNMSEMVVPAPLPPSLPSANNPPPPNGNNSNSNNNNNNNNSNSSNNNNNNSSSSNNNNNNNNNGSVSSCGNTSGACNNIVTINPATITNANPGYASRSAAPSAAANSHAIGGPPSHVIAGGSSRYDSATRSNPRNGQQQLNDESTGIVGNPRSRAERR